MTPYILVADDSTAIQKVIKIAFSSVNFVMHLTSTLSEARAALQEHPYDLVIADVNLPGIQSVDDFLKLTENIQPCPFIFLTGSFEDHNEESFAHFHFPVRILKKPFDAKDLISLAKSMLAKNFSNLEAKDSKIPAKKSATHDLDQDGDLDADLSSGGFAHREISSANVQTRLKGIPAFTPGIPPIKEEEKQKTKTPQKENSDFSTNASSFSKRQNTSEEITDLNSLSQLSQLRHTLSNEQDRRKFAHDFFQSFPRQELLNILEPLIRSEVAKLSESLITEYCVKNFKDLAREVILGEIRKLNDEKAKLLTER